jgi:hypothetical protein
MGLFDIFKGGKKSPEPDGGKASAAAKWAEKAADKRAQNYDRQEAIAELAEMGTAEAATALLKRFTFNMDPSITDQEEKDGAYEGILAAGKAALDPVRAFAAKAESVAWPIKILKALLDEEACIEELLAWLSRWDTEYAKFTDPKLQILVALEDYHHASILPKVERFLEDVNEEARFQAVATIVAQGDEAAVPALLRALEQEESFRVKNKILDGFIAQGWAVPEEQLPATRKALPPDYNVDAQRLVKKR